MKTLKLLKGLAALMGTFTLFFCANQASADYAPGMVARCESLLRQVDSREAQLLEMLAELDGMKYGLPAPVQMQIEALVDKALDDGLDEERIWAESHRLLQTLSASIVPDECPISEDQTPCLETVIKHPEKLEAERIYRTGDAHLRTVSVESRALKEMDRLDLLTVERLFRSVRKGFVPPLSGPGVVRLTDIHRNLVEVKVVQKSVTRLIGCFQSGHLKVKRVYHKRNGGRSGALQAFADLCD